MAYLWVASSIDEANDAFATLPTWASNTAFYVELNNVGAFVDYQLF